MGSTGILQTREGDLVAVQSPSRDFLDFTLPTSGTILAAERFIAAIIRFRRDQLDWISSLLFREACRSEAYYFTRP